MSPSSGPYSEVFEVLEHIESGMATYPSVYIPEKVASLKEASLQKLKGIRNKLVEEMEEDED